MEKIMPEAWRCPCLENASKATEASITSDEIASYLGNLLAQTSFGNHERESLIRCQMYHMQIMGVISEPELITDKDLEWIAGKYVEIRDMVKPVTGYIMPSGSVPATMMHIICAKTRFLARYVYLMIANENKKCAPLLEFVNMLSNYYFYFAIWLNEQAGIDNSLYKSFSQLRK
ncbi:MAG: hypothetical protein PHI01_03500 [Candidatus Izemoplasmatales bacterium]|nr:hypothetical protein [Candidatus Izemoplasmatales bacterium]